MKKKHTHTPDKRPKRISLLHGCVLVALCFITYANGVRGEFVWDDQVQLFRNARIRTVDSIPHAFTSSLWSFMYSQDPTTNNSVFDLYYRPLQEVIYILVYQVSGLSPVAYHVANLILHAAATVVVYLLCLELGLEPFIALLAGSIFAVHPVHTEAVTWIAGVGDLACGTFYFAALATFLRYCRSGVQKWRWISAICFLAALFSKEMAATFPIVVFLILITESKTRRAPKSAFVMMWPYVVAGSIYAVFRVAAVGVNAGANASTSARLIDWVTLGVWAVGNYFRYAIVPYPLYIYHVTPLQFDHRILSTLFSTAMIAAVALAVFVMRRRFPDPCLWVVIFFATLLPVLYFKGISGVFFAERYLYIPTMAVAVVAGFLLAKLNRTHALIVTGVIVGVFGLMTIQRNRDWLNEEKLYARTLQFQPEAVNIWTSLGEVYLREGNNTRAEAQFQTAMERLSDKRFSQTEYESYRIYHGLGLAAARASKPAIAVPYLEKAIDIYPLGDAAYTTLGGVLVNTGQDYARAIGLLEKAIQLNPTNDLARDYMGVALVNQGQLEKAIPYFRQALEINPDLESAKQHLQFALQAEKKS
jgi:protein O-mannosyl-transferase